MVYSHKNAVGYQHCVLYHLNGVASLLHIMKQVFSSASLRFPIHLCLGLCVCRCCWLFITEFIRSACFFSSSSCSFSSFLAALSIFAEFAGYKCMVSTLKSDGPKIQMKNYSPFGVYDADGLFVTLWYNDRDYCTALQWINCRLSQQNVILFSISAKFPFEYASMSTIFKHLPFTHMMNIIRNAMFVDD